MNAGNNTLIAVGEGRKFGCGDFGPPPPPGRHGWGQHDLVIRRSTSGGETWEGLTTILDALDFPPWKALDAEAKPDNGNAVWDPTPGKFWILLEPSVCLHHAHMIRLSVLQCGTR